MEEAYRAHLNESLVTKETRKEWFGIEKTRVPSQKESIALGDISQEHVFFGDDGEPFAFRNEEGVLTIFGTAPDDFDEDDYAEVSDDSRSFIELSEESEEWSCDTTKSESAWAFWSLD